MFTNSYNPQRQLLFVRRQVALSQQSWLIAAGAVFGLLLVVSVFTAIFQPSGLPGVQGFYLAVFLFGGLILSSMAFKELHSPHRSYFFLTLPASTLEKLVGIWLLTSPLYILGFTLVGFIIYLLSFLIGGVPFSLSYFFNEGYREAISTYLVIQTIFLWGACYFRKNNFLKTVLAGIALFIALGMYSGLLVASLFDLPGEGTSTVVMDQSDNTDFEEGEGAYIEKDGEMVHITQEDMPGMKSLMENTIEPTMMFLFWGILGPYMLVMSYYTLKERQV